MNVSLNTVWRVQRDEGMHPYHAQKVKGLDYQRITGTSQFYPFFSFLQHKDVNLDFCAYVMFTDKYTFSLEVTFNIHNYPEWADGNPYTISPHSFQKHFAVNIRAVIVHDHQI